VSMRDLGAYAPCPHACEYCYAHPGKPVNYDPRSEMLCDCLRGDEIIFDPQQVSLCA
jgi:DNA repair photolyase